LAQHRVQQTGSDLSASVFEHGKTIAEIERPVAALSALLVKADLRSSLAAEPSQSTQQLVSGHAQRNRALGHRSQAGKLLVGGGLGNAVLFSIGAAFRARLVDPGYKLLQDRYKVDEIEHAADCVVWCCDEAPGGRRTALLSAISSRR
jgi:hypothetical protein